MVRYFHKVLNLEKLTPAQKIASSFLLVILVGTLFLMLPISNRDGQFLSPVDALFTATSATCVTGLVTTVTIEQFNIFGQIVIICLIQTGGLGLMTLMAVFILFLKSRLSINEKIAMKEMLNQDKVFDMRRFLMDIISYTMIFEIIGAVLLSFRMIPDYGMLAGIWKSIFLSVSAFCNAGFDVIGDVSLVPYVHDPLVCITIMCLIVLGGLGFAVWFDVRDKLRPLLKREITFTKFRKSLTIHSRIVLFTTAILIVGTALIIFFVEYSNPETIGTFTFPQKILTSFFESITLRTAGFASVIYGGFHIAVKFLMMIVMFIGGSSGGTAGGVKTTTIAVLVLYIVSMLKGKENTTIFKRTIPRDTIVHAVGIFFINTLVLFTGIFLLCIVEDHQFEELAFEAVSAMATVGLSLGITPTLSVAGKLIIVVLMFVGRIGITTFIVSLMKKRASHKHSVAFPNGNVIVG